MRSLSACAIKWGGTTAALKMARQYFVETGEPQRRAIVARRQSYHGNTLGALTTGGNARQRTNAGEQGIGKRGLLLGFGVFFSGQREAQHGGVLGDADVPRAAQVELVLANGESIERWIALR